MNIDFNEDTDFPYCQLIKKIQKLSFVLLTLIGIMLGFCLFLSVKTIFNYALFKESQPIDIISLQCGFFSLFKEQKR